jgi:hypothetical protein
MMTFDSYLQQRGFGTGTQLSPAEANAAYAEYQSAAMPAAIVASRQSAPAQQPQQQSNPMMGAAGGIGMGMLQGQGGAGGASGGGFGGGSWAGVPGGAISGAMAGHQAAQNDPNMSNGKDGFGKHYRDSRAEVGGAVAGGVMGYYGLGALAGPAVTASHPYMEPATRWLINTGDSFGGAGGALMMDPIGTVASGKYSGGELAKGFLLGPLSKYV